MFHLCHVIEVETEVIDKLKYIEETKDTMDKNSNKLSEIKDSMNKIFAGKSNHTEIWQLNLTRVTWMMIQTMSFSSCNEIALNS